MSTQRTTLRFRGRNAKKISKYYLQSEKGVWEANNYEDTLFPKIP